MRKFLKRLLLTLFLLGAIGAASIIAFNVWLHNAYAERVYASLDDVPLAAKPRVAIVLGAGLTRSGEPTPALYDRVATAVELYQRGLVDKLLLTGDNRFVNYNEPEAMRRTAVNLGVPDEDLVLDYAGRRTYDSCYRAREIFGVNRAILVTQAFHLDRALYLCDSFGIESIGVAADRRTYTTGSQTWWSIREAAATLAAWIDVNVTKPVPVLGDKLPIGN
ncbi:MAG TPA: ElyC/SanA/YdcF family protein [Anaerolineae bacterium]|nr:ElyC/SanA/YdcF family protein [Anaerolineae bacterium]